MHLRLKLAASAREHREKVLKFKIPKVVIHGYMMMSTTMEFNVIIRMAIFIIGSWLWAFCTYIWITRTCSILLWKSFASRSLWWLLTSKFRQRWRMVNRSSRWTIQTSYCLLVNLVFDWCFSILSFLANVSSLLCLISN